jgi:hypothetical protein
MTTASRIRKSIDRLTAAELADYEHAFAKLKEISEADPSDIDGPQYFQDLHNTMLGPCEHANDTFMPWHPGAPVRVRGGPAPVRPAAHRQGGAAVLGLVRRCRAAAATRRRSRPRTPFCITRSAETGLSAARRARGSVTRCRSRAGSSSRAPSARPHGRRPTPVTAPSASAATLAARWTARGSSGPASARSRTRPTTRWTTVMPAARWPIRACRPKTRSSFRSTATSTCCGRSGRKTTRRTRTSTPACAGCSRTASTRPTTP